MKMGKRLLSMLLLCAMIFVAGCAVANPAGEAEAEKLTIVLDDEAVALAKAEIAEEAKKLEKQFRRKQMSEEAYRVSRIVEDARCRPVLNAVARAAEELNSYY